MIVNGEVVMEPEDQEAAEAAARRVSDRYRAERRVAPSQPLTDGQERELEELILADPNYQAVLAKYEKEYHRVAYLAEAERLIDAFSGDFDAIKDYAHSEVEARKKQDRVN